MSANDPKAAPTHYESCPLGWGAHDQSLCNCYFLSASLADEFVENVQFSEDDGAIEWIDENGERVLAALRAVEAVRALSDTTPDGWMSLRGNGYRQGWRDCMKAVQAFLEGEK